MNAAHSARWPPTSGPSRSAWAKSPPLGCSWPALTNPVIITQPESWYSFYRPAEGGSLHPLQVFKSHLRLICGSVILDHIRTRFFFWWGGDLCASLYGRFSFLSTFHLLNRTLKIMQILTLYEANVPNLTRCNFLQHIHKFIIFGWHNPQIFKRAVVYSSMNYLFNIRPKLRHWK